MSKDIAVCQQNIRYMTYADYERAKCTAEEWYEMWYVGRLLDEPKLLPVKHYDGPATRWGPWLRAILEEEE